jgi:hypothetical protein
MIESYIRDGDIAVFHLGVTGGSSIFVVSIENTPMVKRVDRDLASRTVILYSANPA